MSKVILTVGLMLLVIATSYVSAAVDKEASINATFATMPLAFTENQGQWPDSILYRASAGGATMWFTPTGVHYQFTHRIPRTMDPDDTLKDKLSMKDKIDQQPNSIEISMIKADFVGANPNPSVEGVSPMEYKCNYFLGNEPAQWRADVPNYESIQYNGVYPGIDLKYYGNGKQMEYDFIVSPGANYSQIQIRYDGAESLTLGDNGELIIKVANGEIIEQPPIVYQTIDGLKDHLECSYVITGQNTFSFEVDERYNPAKELTIDPLLKYSTYLGGSDDDVNFGIAVDESGAAYVTGYTYSTNFPTQSGYQTDQPNVDVFVSKISSDGRSLVYSTYLGGSSTDVGYDIAIDASGSAYVTGYTYSTDYPLTNQFQTNQADRDAFVTKLFSAGNGLYYSTYLGGSGDDGAQGIAVDASGSAYMTGWTTSTNFPTVSPQYQGSNQGLDDVFVTKLSSSGNSLVYGTYLGGSSWDVGYSIAVDGDGAAYVTGYTFSTNFPTVNEYQTYQGNRDIFVSKFSSAGTNLLYSTYVGGSNDDHSDDIAVDDSGAAYFTGYTNSTNYPTVNPAWGFHIGLLDIIVTKLSSNGSSLEFSTYWGTTSEDRAFSIAVDRAQAVFITGYTYSTNFPIGEWFQQWPGDINFTNAFITKFQSTGSYAVYSSYLGGNSWDQGNAIAVDTLGLAFMAGNTESTNFPMINNPYQSTNLGFWDVFVAKVGCCITNRGDLNGDGDDANVIDLTYAIDRVYRGGFPASCAKEGDCNGDGISINILDVTFLVDAIFRGGPFPGTCNSVL